MDPANSSKWFGSAVFASLALFATLMAMLPMGLAAGSAVTPDIFFALSVAWVIRRPDTAPIAVVFLGAIFADIMLMRPLGLWALIIVLSVEAVRSQAITIREQMFFVEWLIFVLTFGVALLIYALILKITFTPVPNFGLIFGYFLNTILTYPAVVAILHWVFRVRAPKSPGGSNRLGHVR